MYRPQQQQTPSKRVNVPVGGQAAQAKKPVTSTATTIGRNKIATYSRKAAALA